MSTENFNDPSFTDEQSSHKIFETSGSREQRTEVRFNVSRQATLSISTERY